MGPGPRVLAKVGENRSHRMFFSLDQCFCFFLRDQWFYLSLLCSKKLFPLPLLLGEFIAFWAQRVFPLLIDKA